MMAYTNNSGSVTDIAPIPSKPFIHVALPVMDEPEWLPITLRAIAAQTYTPFRVVACVNQPDSWWSDTEKVQKCHNNQLCLNILQDFRGAEVTILDHTSIGRGWKGKQHGVGFARKTAMDHIARTASPDDILLSLDADTTFPDGYFQSVADTFSRIDNLVALAVPYYHLLTGREGEDRAILRYEIYMRHYFLSLARLNSPYSFTALGSAMAVPVYAYRAIGGITPKLSGEDFYFLQKLRKYGSVGIWNPVMVNPAARFSDRVFFGTGPAMIRGAAGDWGSYPVYPLELFDQIGETYAMIERMYEQTTMTPVVRFLQKVFREEDPFRPLRQNHKDRARFIRAFHEKLDGLRILQFLKTNHRPFQGSDEWNLRQFLMEYYPESESLIPDIFRNDFSLSTAGKEVLLLLRDFLFTREMAVRRQQLIAGPS